MRGMILVLLCPLLVHTVHLRTSPATGKEVQLSAEQQQLAHFGCVKACRPPSPVESKCVTGCEAAWYQCNDATCQQKVLAHYEKTKGVEKKEEKKEEKKGEAKKEEKKGEEKKEEKKAEKKAALVKVVGAPLTAKTSAQTSQKPMALTADQKKAAHWGCVDACKPSPVESKCITGCEAEYYQCNDATCQQKVLANYKETKGIVKKEEKKEEKKGEAKKEEKKGEEKKEEKKAEKK